MLYLNEQKVSSVQQAAVLADEYILMHKSAFVKRTCYQDRMMRNFLMVIGGFLPAPSLEKNVAIVINWDM